MSSHPKDQTAMFGREAAEEQFMDALGTDRLHHAWLISGPKGTGKATLAYRVARSMLAGEWGIGPEHPVFHRVSAGSHTDLLVLEAPEDPEKDESKREIPIELARQVGGFLSLTPAEGDWRVVIIDSIDELNTNAANAILKVLEEPPPRALILLTSHNPGRLLPTIRSRCRALKLGPLPEKSFAAAMRHLAPSQDAEDTRILSVLSENSPGVALMLKKQDGIGMYETLIRYAQGQETTSTFADHITGSAPHTQWQMLSHLIRRYYARALELSLPRTEFEEVVKGEEAACRALLAACPLSTLTERYARAESQFSVAAKLHLDYKSVLFTFLPTLQRKAPA